MELIKHESVAYDNKNMDTYVFRKIGSDEGYKQPMQYYNFKKTK